MIKEVVMDTNLTVAIVAASASMVAGIFGMWINASQTGKQMANLQKGCTQPLADETVCSTKALDRYFAKNRGGVPW